MPQTDFERVLVTDFDGTLTKRDFYSCVVAELLAPEDLQPWNDYVAGQITHFEALRQIFGRIRATESQLMELLPQMEFDPRARESFEKLRDEEWDIVIVSNGCDWYIRRLFERHQIDTRDLRIHTSPSRFSPTDGLHMILPSDSPYFSMDLGISKDKVVRSLQQQYRIVAFAGDGRPDIEPAMRVSADLRFATGWLATTLEAQGKSYRKFEVWSQIAEQLCDGDE